MFISYIWRLLIWKKITFLWTKRGRNRNEMGWHLGEQSLRRPPGRQIFVLNTGLQQQNTVSLWPPRLHPFCLLLWAPVWWHVLTASVAYACVFTEGATCYISPGSLGSIAGRRLSRELWSADLMCQVRPSPTSRAMSGQGQGVHPPHLPFLFHFLPENKTPDPNA